MNYTYRRDDDGIVVIVAEIDGCRFDVADVYSRPFRESEYGKRFDPGYALHVQESFAEKVCKALNKV